MKASPGIPGTWQDWLQRGEAEAAAFRYAPARDALQQAVSLGAPASALGVLAAVRAELGDTDGAIRDLDEAVRRDPGNPALALSAATMLPMVYRDVADLDRWRERYEARLRAFAIASRKPSSRDAEILAWSRANFLLAYQGRNDRELQATLCEAIAMHLDRALPSLARPVARPARARRRVGFASAYFFDCTVGRYFSSWIAGLHASGFEVVVFSLGAMRDPWTDRIAADADRFVSVAPGQGAGEVARQIAEAELDVLVYPEVGMDPHTRLLSCLRLAPVQLAAWGHPETTGSSRIDAYVTCGEMEPRDAADHYVEPLIALPGLGVDYEAPAAVPPLRREDLGLGDAQRLYFCPHSVFKLHPDTDALFASILARDPGGVLVIFQGQASTPEPARAFAVRLADALAARGVPPGRQVRVLPRLDAHHFRRALQAADVVIDPLHWSGGNTALDALACGVPVVSVPGALMRSRQAAAMLARTGVPELVATGADDAARIALEIAHDQSLRDALSRRIVSGCGALFSDPQPVQRFVGIVARLASGEPPRALSAAQ